MNTAKNIFGPNTDHVHGLVAIGDMRAARSTLAATTAVLMGLALACSPEADEAVELADGPDDVALSSGKADSIYSECEIEEALVYVNRPEITVESLVAGGVHSRAAKGIVAHRAGLDGTVGTDDDVVFATARELDEVRYVGPVAFRSLIANVAYRCQGLGGSVEVVMSPARYEDSHIVKTIEWIEGAEHTLDIAMYSMWDYKVLDALDRAVQRGVRVRMLYEGANEHRKSDSDGTMSAKLEKVGVDVRYTNKIMHHKFVIIDGPTEDLTRGHEARLVTGSANWSWGAATSYDENTVFVAGNTELIMRFQGEFNHLWRWSRDYSREGEDPLVETIDLGDDPYREDMSVEASFTSDNFETSVSSRYGNTFSTVAGRNTVADQLVAAILSARSSIWIASGHMRSRPVAEALIEAMALNPQLDVRIYLDQQEFVSEAGHDRQLEELQQCLRAAGDSAAKVRGCTDTGFRFGLELARSGAQVRYKTYAYKWHYSYAAQMHHKYLLVDGHTLISGSYNLSDNAEHNTLENMVSYDAATFPGLVGAFTDNFESIWRTGEADDRHGRLLELIQSTDGELDIVFEPMALEWEEVAALRELIEQRCPEVQSDAFHAHPEQHQTCVTAP